MKEKLTLDFEMKDLGSLWYFLGMEVTQNREGISVSQRKYILDLLQETGMLDCKSTDTSMDSSIKLSTKLAQGPMDNGRYQRLVGKLI